MSNASIPIEDEEAKAVFKRYECLAAVRTKAVKGKGAWYWAHLEPILIRDSEMKPPKAVKLKCTLCDAAFSASNPSRTATEHLKKGTCPNFNSTLQLPPLASPTPRKNSNRKRCLQSQESVDASLDVCPLNMVDPSRFLTNEVSFLPAPPLYLKPLQLSGGKEDYGPLARLESSVKKLKSPGGSSPSPALSRNRVKRAFDALGDWFYDSCGVVSFSSLEHPKFRAFLNQVGFPAALNMDFLSSRLESKFDQARMESEARISDAAFFQVACDGWKAGVGSQRLVKFTVNLPNRTAIFRKAMSVDGAAVPSQYAEEVLWETIQGICGGNVQRCVGVVSDKYKAKALRNLELQNHWMINLSCQVQGLFSLIKDLYRELPLFKTVSDNCTKIASLINSTPQIRNSFHRFRLQGYDIAGFIRVPHPKCDVSKIWSPFIAMLDDLLSCSRILNLIVSDDSCKVGLLDVCGGEVAAVIQDVGFWRHVEAAHSLVKMIMAMAEDIEAERPSVGQCLPLWEELRAKIKEWCTKNGVAEGPVEKILERRFRKVYHPAWSAAFILDPLYLVRDASGKYLPPFKCLTHEQEKDVDKLVTRLVSREEAHIALMELMKWRSDGLDPLYAQAVQVRQHDAVTGKLKVANPQGSRLVWETYLKDFKILSKVAVRLLFLQATSCGIKHDSSFTRWFCGQGNSRSGSDRAQKLIFVAAHAKLERQDYSSPEEKDAELFGSIYGDDDMLNEVLEDTPST
ncbi:hypothetical protein SASPL_123048 [Salvia splendens]|uniref:DUF7963 domain-containing protein n=1 Tax=Salvia splendens TaxID=180675 RepID=A0A8X8XJM4_SALSN|nr:uncharacterized protein LOC121743003 [Salvia splendens]KAG6415635.1 hypothetical protein SASPL_123048 [Salvia splendens]